MQILKGDLSNVKGIPPSGLCVGVHRAGAVHQKMVAKHGDGLAVWSLRPDLDFIAFKKEGLGEQGIRSTSDMESIDAGEKLIYGVRGAPPEVREKAREKGLTLLADATRLAAAAGAADVDVTLEIWPNMIHAWPVWNASLEDGRRALARAGQFIRARTLQPP